MGSRPRWTDFHKNWLSCRGWLPNHSFQFLFQYFLAVLDLQVVKVFVFPLTLLVIVTTVLWSWWNFKDKLCTQQKLCPIHVSYLLCILVTLVSSCRSAVIWTDPSLPSICGFDALLPANSICLITQSQITFAAAASPSVRSSALADTGIRCQGGVLQAQGVGMGGTCPWKKGKPVSFLCLMATSCDTDVW